MAINLTNPNLQKGTSAPAVTVQPTATEVTSIEPVQQYDIVADKEQLVQNMDMQKIDELTSQIDISDMGTIVSFGSQAAEEISKASDTVLNNMSLTQLNETGEVMKSLSKIMEQFNIDELKEPKGLQKLFNKAQAQLEKVLKKGNVLAEFCLPSECFRAVIIFTIRPSLGFKRVDDIVS